jgi:uncharacterized membrane protein
MATQATLWRYARGEGRGRRALRAVRDVATQRTTMRRRGDGELRVADGLGWLSLALGGAALLATGRTARLIGLPDAAGTRRLLRLVGTRELASALGILRQPRAGQWLWGRVAGDAMDLTLLTSALGSRAVKRSRVAAATAAVLGVTAMDLLASREVSRRKGLRPHVLTDFATLQVHTAITVNKPVGEVYRFWHDFQNLARFMRHLESVQIIDERRSRWKAKGPAGKLVEWEAEIVRDEPDRLIAWRSREGSQVETSGSVRFQPAPGQRGTELIVDLTYRPPAGVVGAGVARLLGQDPAARIREDIRRFKQLVETGEIVSSEGPSARRRPSPFERERRRSR